MTTTLTSTSISVSTVKCSNQLTKHLITNLFATQPLTFNRYTSTNHNCLPAISHLSLLSSPSIALHWLEFICHVCYASSFPLELKSLQNFLCCVSVYLPQNISSHSASSSCVKHNCNWTRRRQPATCINACIDAKYLIELKPKLKLIVSNDDIWLYATNAYPVALAYLFIYSLHIIMNQP